MAQQLVADAVTQRVVDFLEMVEVDEEHDERARRGGNIVLQLGDEEAAIGKVRQRIVMGHMRDLGGDALALGHVFMGRNPAAVRHRIDGHQDAAPIGELLHLAVAPIARQVVAPDIGRGIEAHIEPARGAFLQDFLEMRTGLQFIGRHPPDEFVLPVVDDEASMNVIHRDAMRHMRQGSVEPQVRDMEFF